MQHCCWQGLAIGGYFGYPEYGLLVAMGGILLMHLQRLLRLERDLSRRVRIEVPSGDGIWARVLAGVRYQQQRVRRHKSRYRRLMKEVKQSTNAMPDGIVALNSVHEIQRFNSAAEDMVGLRKRRDRGQRIDNLVRHPDFVAYLKNGNFEHSVTIPAPRREDGWLSIQVVTYSNDNRLLIIRDVTERTRLSRMRRDFVANASHELRTPLTVLSGYLEAMYSDSVVRDDWAKPLEEMSQQAQRMRTMLDELLALSRLEASAHASTEKVVDIATIVRDCALMYETPARRVRISIETEAAVLGEYSDLTSVVTNLLSNAVRYSPADAPIEIRWELITEGAVLSVIDEGEGIAPEDIPRLTERFFRVSRGRSRETGGVGLGLAIVKHALARHDATLFVDSTLGEGSRFSCHFPIERLSGAATDSVIEASG